MEEALRAFIMADPAVTAIAEDRADWGLRPQGSKLPAVALSTISGADDVTHDGPSGLVETRVQIDCWARTIGEAKRLDRAITALLNGKRFAQQLPFNGLYSPVVEFRPVILLSRRDLNDGDAKGALYRVSLDFQIWHGEGWPVPPPMEMGIGANPIGLAPIGF